MRTSKEHRAIRQCAACVMMMVSVLLAGAGAAVGREFPAASLTDTSISRNSLLEESVAARLKAERFNRSSRILVLATSNRVYLIGVVPNETVKEQAILSAGQVPGVRGVADHLVVRSEPLRKGDLRLRRDIEQGLRPVENKTGKDIHAQTYKGDALLGGSVRGWEEMAQALQVAFAAGAHYVVSDLTIDPPRH